MIEFLGANWSKILNGIFFVFSVWIAFTYWQKFYKPIENKNKQILDCIAAIESYKSTDIRQSYNELDAALEQNALIGLIWKKYKKTLVFVRESDMDCVYSTVDASEYFYPAALTGEVNTKFWPGLAGVFTGIGIFGTFLGLTLSLWGIDTSSTSALSSSITKLLGGMSTAFFTSLVGLSLALVFGWYHSKRMDQFHRNIEKLADALDAIFKRKNLEGIILEQLREIQQERTAIQSLSTQMAASICDLLPDILGQMAERMDEAMKGNLDTMLDGLSAKLDEQTEKLKNVEKHTEALANGFGNAINENAGEEAKALGNSLMQLSGEINELTGSVKEMIKESQNTAAKANADMAAAVEQAMKNLDKTMEGILSKQTAKTDENIQRMTDFMEEMKETMANIFTEMSKLAKDQATITSAAIAKTQNATDENLTRINSTVKELMAQIAIQMAAMQALVDAQQKNMDGTLAKMRSAVDSSSDVVKSAGKAVEEFGSAAKDTREQFALAAREAAGTIKEAAEPFTEAARPLKDAAASVDGSLKTLSAAMKLHGDTTAKAANEMKAMVEGQELSAKNIQESLETAQKAWQAYEANFKGVNEEMAKVFENLQNGLRNYNATTSDGLQKALQAFDGGFAKTVGTLASISEDVADPIEDLQKSIDQLSENIRKMRR